LRALSLLQGVLGDGEVGAEAAEAYLNQGFLLAQRDSLDSAVNAYEHALALDPSLTQARYSLAGLHLLLGHHGRSAREYETVLSGDADDGPYSRRARVRLRQIYPVLGDSLLAAGAFTEARVVYERLDGLGAATAAHLTNLALLLQRAGDPGSAIDAARRALALEPGFAKAHFTLGGLLEAAGDRAEAAGAFEAFLAVWEGEEAVAAEARRRLEILRRGINRSQ